MILADVTSKSVRQLKFNHHLTITKEMCIELCNTTLGIQCEILEININEGNAILYLIENMPNLRLLQIQYDDSAQNPPYNDLLEWLGKCFPSTCTIKSRRNDLYTIWVR